MSRTSDDLRQMAQECRRLASTCDTPEAQQALKGTAREMDVEALQLGSPEGLSVDARTQEERGLSENPDRGSAATRAPSVADHPSATIHTFLVEGSIT